MAWDIDQHRQSGRTTRMIERAVRLARDGRAVCIIAANEREAARLASMLPRDWPHGIKVEILSLMDAVDWLGPRVTDAHQNCTFFVDHYTIETHYAGLLHEYHRYDPKE